MKKLELYHKRNIGTGEKYLNELVYRHLINFTLEQLISKNLKNKLKLKVYFRKKNTFDKKTVGYLLTYATTKTTPVRNAKMYIRVDMSFLNILETITHELVHLKQYATGQLNKRIWKTDNQVHYRWEKKEMGVQEAIEYKNRPWEIEAFTKQFPLVDKWTNYIKEPKNWTKENKLGLIWDVVLDNVRLELNKLNDKIASKNNNEKRKQLIKNI
jgi:hypothetical protein